MSEPSDNQRDGALAPEELTPDVVQAVDGAGDLWHALDGCFASQRVAAPGEHPFRAAVLAHMRGEPVAAARLERGPRALVLGVALLGAVLMTFVHGLRPDLGEHALWTLALPVLVFAFGFVAGGRAFDTHRGALVDLAAPAAGIGVFLAAAFLFEPTPSTIHPRSVVGSAIGCAAYGLVVALLVLLPAIVVARRSMAGPTRFGAALLGLVAGGLAVGSLHVGCGVVDPVHQLLGHGLVFGLGVALALGLRRVRRFS